MKVGWSLDVLGTHLRSYVLPDQIVDELVPADKRCTGFKLRWVLLGRTIHTLAHNVCNILVLCGGSSHRAIRQNSIIDASTSVVRLP